MPKQAKHWPYVRVNAAGRLQYYRRIPEDRRHLFGNRVAFTQVLATDPSKPTSKAAHRAWKQADDAYERLLSGESRAETQGAKTPPKPEHAQPLPLGALPLTPRDVAGLAAEPLKNLLKSAESGQISDEMMERLLLTVRLSAQLSDLTKTSDDPQLITQLLLDVVSMWTQGGLKKRGLRPDVGEMLQIFSRITDYLPVLTSDLRRRKQGDYGPSELERISPPPPKSQVTYEDLVEQWLLDAGGYRTENGSGVSEKRTECYRRAIAELIRESGKRFPAEVGIDDARGYVNWVQEQTWAIATKQQRLTCVSNLFSIGVRLGLLQGQGNPFAEMRIRAPKNAREQSYRPFTKEEVKAIVRELEITGHRTRSLIVKLLLVTGARSSDISKLRYRDIKATEAGVVYLDLVDEPSGAYPHPLKGGAGDERRTPLHPWLLEQPEFSELVGSNIGAGGSGLGGSGLGGYIFGEESNSKLSAWFRRLLKQVGIDEPRCAVLHSLRGTWIDLMREARLPAEVCRAITGHSSKDVQDKVYGEGLQSMPDVLYQELIKVDLSWLP